MTISQVIVGPLDQIVRDQSEPDKVVAPMRRVRLIFANGKIFDRMFIGFREELPAVYAKHYEEHPELWTKHDPYEKTLDN